MKLTIKQECDCYCTICNKQFKAQRSNAKYCSKDCMNAARRIRHSEKKDLGIKSGLKPRSCVICDQEFTPLSASANLRQYCYSCLPNGVTASRGYFLELIKRKLGGSCIICGYDRCIKALEFHHINPSEKEFTISSDIIKVKEAIEESRKCILICSNCHKEIHAGVRDMEGRDLSATN